MARHLVRTTARNLLCGLLLVASFALVSHFVPRDMTILDSSVSAPAPSQAERLLERHDCWTDEAPADMQGVIPGGVVATRDGVTIHGGSRLVGQALEQIFDGADNGLTVHGFCQN